MKKLLFVLLAFFIFFAASGQNKPASQAPDTAATETTPLLTYQDVQTVIDKVLADLPMKCGDPVRNALIGLVQQRAQEYAAKKKLQAKQK